ncbi:hypothetical protein [Nocardioides sp. Soil796]|uniref:hypothetical protein n=1 Tax=Nocardioides sp. Soil796 TaxID=1736412 RepID=UPI00070A511E|nr:hypothetical protein [Nocardioides sp. Soil796]KRF16285.1 hypothetical protein ASH02_06830 [Nocardioides sp. Soil796]
MTHSDDHDLRTRMHDSLAGASLDLDTLVDVATHAGTRIRRRRTIGTCLAAAACVSVLAVGGTVLGLPGGGSGNGAVAAAPSATSTPSPSTPSPTVSPVVRTRTLTAALVAKVSDLVPGTTKAYGGQDDHLILSYVNRTQAEGNGAFDFTPTATGDAGRVFVGFQPTAPDPTLFTCQRQSGKYSDDVGSCTRTVTDSGSTVITFEEQVPQVDGSTLVIRTADALQADGSRVTIRASNSVEPSDDAKGQQVFTVEGDPGLTLAQLRTLVAQDGWSLQGIEQYADAGNALAPFDDFSQKS